MRKVPYDSAMTSPRFMQYAIYLYGLVVGPMLPGTTVKRIHRLRQGQPGKIRYSTAGRGPPAPGHGTAALKEKIKWTHIPFEAEPRRCACSEIMWKPPPKPPSGNARGRGRLKLLRFTVKSG